MATSRLPSVAFERVLCLKRLLPAESGPPRVHLHWLAIGRLGGSTPFLLSYGGAITNWWCEVPLGAGLRKKILLHFRAEVRGADPLPATVVQHDLTTLDAKNLRNGALAAEALWLAFFEQEWKACALGQRPAQEVQLAGPFAEKDAATALGASWNPTLRKWCVKGRADLASA